jgi:hypothetical protein
VERAKNNPRGMGDILLLMTEDRKKNKELKIIYETQAVNIRVLGSRSSCVISQRHWREPETHS